MTPVIRLATRVTAAHSVMVVVRRHYVVFELSERSRRSGGPGPQRSVALAASAATTAAAVTAVTGARRLVVVVVMVFAHVHCGQHLGPAQQSVVETAEYVALDAK